VPRIPTGIESHEVAASPDGRLAVVTNTGPYSDPGHTLFVIDMIKFTPDGKRALATQMGGPLIVLDVASRKKVKRIDTSGGGSSILVVPDGSRAYIGMTGEDKVAVVSALKTGEGPDGLAWVGGP